MSNRGGYDSNPRCDPGPSYGFNPSYLSRPYVSPSVQRYTDQVRYPVDPSAPPPSYQIAVLRTSDTRTQAKLIIEDKPEYDEEVNVFHSARHRSPVSSPLNQTRNNYRQNDGTTKNIPNQKCLVYSSLYIVMFLCLVILALIAYCLFDKDRLSSRQNNPILNETTVDHMFSENPNLHY